MNTIIHVQDKGQDAVTFTCDKIGRILDVSQYSHLFGKVQSYRLELIHCVIHQRG